MNSVFKEDLELIVNNKSINWDKYKNKTVLVTGATGMIGSLLVRSFLTYNALKKGKISVIAAVRNKDKAKRVFSDLLEDSNFMIYIGDVVEEIKIEADVDFIFHTASVTVSKQMVDNPVETIETAYQGTNNILKLARDKAVEGVVYISSMEVYGNPDSSLEYIREKDLGYIDLTNVRSSYSEGKRICECLCTAYASEYRIPVRIARLAQTFGAGIHESDNRVYAQFAKSSMNGSDIVLHTDGKSEGNYCYTRDVVIALLMLGYTGKTGEAYNIVNQKSHMQIREMAELVASKIAKGRINVIYDIPESNMKYGYAPSVKMHLSSEKMNALGWHAEVGMEEAYERMISYMREGE